MRNNQVVQLSSFCAVKPAQLAVSFRASALGLFGYDPLLNALGNTAGVQIEKQNKGSDVTITVGIQDLSKLADNWHKTGLEVACGCIRDHNGRHHPSVPALLQHYAR